MRQYPSRLRRLDDALAALPLEEPMLLTELDGFLAGVLVCPDPILPDEWLPVVWGGEEAGGAPFDDPIDVQWFADAVLARYNEIARDMGRGRPKPIFDVGQRNGEILWEYWLDGFEQAMDLRPDAWTTLAESDDPDAARAMSGLSLLIDVAHNESDLDSLELDKVHDEASADIIAIVLQLHASRLRAGSPGAPTLPDMPAKIGRNEPCGCGSGKKFKRCCG